jgi:nicotinamidase-related amidase
MPFPAIPQALEDFLAPERTALILWDFQVGLAGHAVNRAQLQEAATRLIAAAEDAGIMIIWSRHVLPTLELIPGSFLRFLMRKQNVSRVEDLRPTMQAGMEETEFLPGLKPQEHHIVIEKSTPSLFVNTPLDLRLHTCGISNLVLAGVATNIGIEFTARHAQALGYYTVIAEDATGSYSEEAQARSIAFLRSQNPVTSAADICKIWQRTPARERHAEGVAPAELGHAG